MKINRGYHKQAIMGMARAFGAFNLQVRRPSKATKKVKCVQLKNILDHV